jgi:hypothetical protein
MLYVDHLTSLKPVLEQIENLRKERCDAVEDLTCGTAERMKWKDSSGIFKKSMGARHRVGIGLLYRPARLHIGWRNSFLRIDSWAP